MISKQVKDWIEGFDLDTSKPPKVVGPIMMFEVSISIWESTLDLIKIRTFSLNYESLLSQKEDEIIEMLEFINKSQDEIIKELERDAEIDINEFRPSKVSSILLDYTQDIPELSFYIESNEDYHYHIYIRQDKSFDAGYIS